MVDTSTSRLHAAMYSRLASREKLHRGHPRPHRDVQAPPSLLRHLREELLPFSRCALARGATAASAPRPCRAAPCLHRARTPATLRVRPQWKAPRCRVPSASVAVCSGVRATRGLFQSIRPLARRELPVHDGVSKSWKRTSLLSACSPRTEHRSLRPHPHSYLLVLGTRSLPLTIRPSSSTPAPVHHVINGHAHPPALVWGLSSASRRGRPHAHGERTRGLRWG
ncbi:hypothetical protein DFH08DRAFT_874500 [Mycena albidolilacea]|uniref:Uncharacterized protein n=1 Tax=Mycena albidolilacea TaxID=1033008 RepID=A0AAD7EPD7_9AGAR|nr:hypothetical protein DFH08DRAFT_874500 [Mycena albidolilacea]